MKVSRDQKLVTAVASDADRTCRSHGLKPRSMPRASTPEPRNATCTFAPSDVFDAETFPQLYFRSTRVEILGDNRLRVVGDLTIRGITRSIALEVENAGRGTDPFGNERIGFAASASIDRKDFNLHWNQVLETGGVLVGDLIKIQLDVQAIKVAAAEQAA